jgi:hypothetical protein
MNVKKISLSIFALVITGMFLMTAFIPSSEAISIEAEEKEYRNAYIFKHEFVLTEDIRGINVPAFIKGSAEELQYQKYIEDNSVPNPLKNTYITFKKGDVVVAYPILNNIYSETSSFYLFVEGDSIEVKYSTKDPIKLLHFRPS